MAQDFFILKNNMQIKSPLTNSNNTQLKKIIKTDLIINEWKKSDIDVSRFFKNIPEIYIYECLDTGYKFFYPFGIEGDDEFYQELQQFDWYYMKDKWEYDEVFKLVRKENKLLEIGCGQGDFLKKLRDNGIMVTGIEFNEEAIRKSKEKGLEIYKETIQEYSKNNKEKYDMVCSFQVMEHIPNIGEAVQASLEVLKPGGKLIISVPNNDSFIKKDNLNLLNTPPHHVGRWNEKTLKNLEKIFNIKLNKILFEPLQEYHYKYYYKLLFGNKINTIFNKFGGKINIIPRKIIFYLLKKGLYKKIKGHSVMAIYTKK